jgi:uncharacterized protein YpuA (DUF1002 family)
MEEIKEKVMEVVDKVKNDKDFATKFQENPVKTVEEVGGIDLPDDQINQIVAGVKAKINVDNVGDILGKVKGLF